MTTRIDITINSVRLEVEVDAEPAEPSTGYQGSYEIVALRTLDHSNYDIWPIIGEIAGVEEFVLEAIEKEGREL